MRDNDIRKIFDNAVKEDTHADIDAEKIQNTVMERLGKRKSENIRFYESEDMEQRVEPVIVTAPAKRSRKAAVIVSAAAAACLVITAISTGFFGIRSGLITSAGDTSDSAEQTDLSAAKTVQEYTAAETLAQQIICVESIGEKYPLKNNSFTFLDGIEIVIEKNTPSGTVCYETANWILSEDNGRVYYWNGKEKKDVTDLISMETPYIDSYENEGSGLTHYIVIWGDIASEKYGYAEMFPTHERAWFFEMVLNRKETEDEEDWYKEEEEWSKEAKKALSGPIDTAIKQISGEGWYMRHGGINRTCFKSVTLPCDR